MKRRVSNPPGRIWPTKRGESQQGGQRREKEAKKKESSEQNEGMTETPHGEQKARGEKKKKTLPNPPPRVQVKQNNDKVPSLGFFPKT